MKEININIEGYNVNGICVACLNYNRKMFYDSEIQECLKNLAEIDVPDGLSVQVCWECLASVRAVNRFRTQLLQSYEVLMDYSQKHTFLNSPFDLAQYSLQRLATTDVDVYSTATFKEEEILVKEEDEDQYDGDTSLLMEMKSEIAPELEPNIVSDMNFNTENGGASSDEDVQLSQLKKKKEKKERKSKREKKAKNKVAQIKEETETEPQKNTRKLKNLPEHLVELYTMTEEEMWRIRCEDLESKEFVKLKYKCNDCIIGFNTEKLMNDHMNGKHRPKGEDCQQCDVCRAYFLTKDNLSVHRSLHMSSFRCKECGVTTSLKSNMMKHVREHGGEGHRCNTCDTVFCTKSKLAYHKNVCHQEKPQCDCCGKVFANKMTLKYHLKIQPQNKDEKPKEKLYIPCKGCNKVFLSKKSYRAHVVIHDGRTYPCPTCGKQFQWKRNLSRHARNHREREAGALHECRQCNKTFSSRDCYNNHMRLSKRHVPENAYGHECNYCGKKFATKWCMVDHIDWDHLKRIKYQCRVCFKAFKTAKIMVAHMNNIHEGKNNREPEGEHLCDICGKSYKTVKRLKGHVWAMHTNRSTTKSFKCKYCPATFTWQTSIYKHTKMMHSTGKRAKPPAPRPPKKPSPPPAPYALQPARMAYFPAPDAGMPTHIGIVHNLVGLDQLQT